jgi:hypothetical protein
MCVCVCVCVCGGKGWLKIRNGLVREHNLWEPPKFARSALNVLKNGKAPNFIESRNFVFFILEIPLRIWTFQLLRFMRISSVMIFCCWMFRVCETILSRVFLPQKCSVASFLDPNWFRNLWFSSKFVSVCDTRFDWFVLCFTYLFFLGSSDPYVIFALGNNSAKSRIIKRNLNPHWNEVSFKTYVKTDRDGQRQHFCSETDQRMTNGGKCARVWQWDGTFDSLACRTTGFHDIPHRSLSPRSSLCHLCAVTHRHAQTRIDTRGHAHTRKHT